jgi:transposase
LTSPPDPTKHGLPEPRRSIPTNRATRPAEAQALGRSRGSYGTKGHVLAAASGRAIAFALTPGQAAELPQAEGLLSFLPGTPLWTVADRGYSSHALREAIRDLGSTPAIPTRSNEAAVICREWVYVNRERVERLWSRLKEWRAVATRYEKTARSFLGVLSLAATFDWIRR